MGSNVRKRTKVISVRVSPEEKAQLSKKSDGFGMGIPQLMRSSALGKHLRSKLDDQAILNLLKINADQGRLGGLLKMWLQNKERLHLAGGVPALLKEIQDTQRLLKGLVEKL